MAKYIERAKVTDALIDNTSIVGNELEEAVNAICAIPAADVRPVKWGKWIGYPECLKYPNAYSDDHIVCSACEECFSILDNDCERFNFCPNCGADMRKSSEEGET